MGQNVQCYLQAGQILQARKHCTRTSVLLCGYVRSQVGKTLYGKSTAWKHIRKNRNVSIYIIKEKLETLSGMESYFSTSDRHAASWIFSDGPSKQLGVVKLRYNALKLFFYNVAILRQRACFRQPTCLFPPATPDTEHCAPHFVAD